MPPRKSNVSTVSNGVEEGADATPAKQAKEGVSVEDLSLPKSMIARLAKGVLPANTSIQKDALLALHKSATVFVNYIASAANENTQTAGKKTIMPADVMTAMKDTEFEEFLPRLEAELKKYNETQCDKRNTYRRKVKEERAAAAAKDGEEPGQEGSAAEGANGQLNGHADNEDAERPFKKFKAQDGVAVAPDADAMDATEETIDNADDDNDDPEDDDVDDEYPGEDEVQDEGGDEVDEDDDRDDIAAAAGVRDEALDDPGSDSE